MSEIVSPYDVEIRMRENHYWKLGIIPLVELALLKSNREGFLEGFAAGDEAHACCKPGCPCYEAGKEAEAEEPSLSGRQT